MWHYVISRPNFNIFKLKWTAVTILKYPSTTLKCNLKKKLLQLLHNLAFL